MHVLVLEKYYNMCPHANESVVCCGARFVSRRNRLYVFHYQSLYIIEIRIWKDMADCQVAQKGAKYTRHRREVRTHVNKSQFSTKSFYLFK